ncbi:hypothetical protein KC340_g131 [Hortaea werneckii]|nr:hypothetical protein KC340_g131 [Hortaea werneckii]
MTDAFQRPPKESKRELSEAKEPSVHGCELNPFAVEGVKLIGADVAELYPVPLQSIPGNSSSKGLPGDMVAQWLVARAASATCFWRQAAAVGLR